MKIDPEDVSWILLKIKYLAERNSPIHLPTHQRIWQGSYDVWRNKQDEIDSIEIPKARMKAALEAGLIKSEVVKMGKYDHVVYSLTELGNKQLEENNEKGT